MAVRQVISCPWQDEQGNALALGTIVFEASGDALVTGTGELCSGIKGSLNLDNTGSVAASPAQYMWPTDQMSPSNITYTVWVYSANGELAWGPNYGLTVPSGAGSFNLCTWVPNQIGSSSGASGGSLTLQVNGVNNAVQSILNLESTDSSVTLTDEGNGSVNLQVSGGAPSTTTPFSTPPTSLSHTTNVTGQGGNNVVNLYFLNIPYEITFSNISWYSATGDNGTDLSDIGIYSVANPSATTATLVANIGATTGIGSASVNTKAVLQAPVTLRAGLYLFVTLSNHGAGFTIDFAIPNQLEYAWSSTSTGVAGVLPATLTLVAKGLSWMPAGGITNFTGGFPAISLS
jgi:hypothetical protein